MNVKEWLKRYYPMHQETTVLLKRLEALEKSETIVDTAEMDEIAAVCKRNIAEMKQIRNTLDAIDSPVESAVLRLRYTDTKGGKLRRWKDIAEMLYLKNDENAIRNATRLHNRALLHLEQMLTAEALR